MSHHDESLIRDDDLRAQLEAARGTSIVFDVVVRSLIASQRKRTSVSSRKWRGVPPGAAGTRSVIVTACNLREAPGDSGVRNCG